MPRNEADRFELLKVDTSVVWFRDHLLDKTWVASLTFWFAINGTTMTSQNNLTITEALFENTIKQVINDL